MVWQHKQLHSPAQAPPPRPIHKLIVLIFLASPALVLCFAKHYRVKNGKFGDKPFYVKLYETHLKSTLFAWGTDFRDTKSLTTKATKYVDIFRESCEHKKIN